MSCRWPGCGGLGAGDRGRQARRAGQQPPGVLVLGIGEDLTGRSGLDHAPLGHDDEMLCPVGGHAEIVGHQQDRGAQFLGEALEMVEDDALHRDVERAGRLVGDDQPRPRGDGDRDQGALPHAAGEFVRVLPGTGGRVRQPGPLQDVDRLRQRGAAGRQTVDAQHLGDLFTDAFDRIEGHRRVLGHQADLRAAHCAQLRLAQRREVVSAEADRARVDRGVGGQEPGDRMRGGALAGPGLADHRGHFARAYVEIDVPHGRYGAAAGAVRHGQAAYLQCGVLAGVRVSARCRAQVLIRSRCVRRALAHDCRDHSPSSARAMRLVASTVAAIASPGSAVNHQALAR